jgi:hypothetical protein
MDVGHIQEIYRYPVKSMAGESLERTQIGWYGLEGDRRFAFNIVADKGGFPWLSASKLPEMLFYKPIRQEPSNDDNLPTHVVTPEGKVLEIRSDELRNEIMRRFEADVRLMHLRQGVFDEAAISLITLATTHKICSDSDIPHDIRRFRPNIVIDTQQGEPFAEDQWVGKTIVLGDAAIQVTNRDKRCMMVNLHPDTVERNPAVMKTVVRLNDNCAGVYGTVIRPGALKVGQRVYTLSEPRNALEP